MDRRAIARELTGNGLPLNKCEAYNAQAVRPGMPATPRKAMQKEPTMVWAL